MGTFKKNGCQIEFIFIPQTSVAIVVRLQNQDQPRYTASFFSQIRVAYIHTYRYIDSQKENKTNIKKLRLVVYIKRYVMYASMF